MVKIEISEHINRPVTEVFKYIADPTKLPEWNAIVEEATPSETPVKVGTRVKQRARFLGRKIESTAEVTEHEPDKRFTTKTDRPFPLTISNAFEPEGSGTKLVVVMEGEPGGFFKVGETILARIAKKQMQAQLDTAKELLEAQVPAER
jgi:uncharacterized protein YndB with AHSA1/START domain